MDLKKQNKPKKQTYLPKLRWNMLKDDESKIHYITKSSLVLTIVHAFSLH